MENEIGSNFGERASLGFVCCVFQSSQVGLSKVSTQLAITLDSLPRSGKVRATIRRDL